MVLFLPTYLDDDNLSKLDQEIIKIVSLAKTALKKRAAVEG